MASGDSFSSSRVLFDFLAADGILSSFQHYAAQSNNEDFKGQN